MDGFVKAFGELLPCRKLTEEVISTVVQWLAGVNWISEVRDGVPI